MFRFFRKLRNTALMESRFVRYVLYALGEILLVVIGILIALYINERQQWREDRQQEQFYLQALQQDLEQNLLELDRVIEKSGGVLRACDSIFDYSKRIPHRIPGDSLLKYMGKISGYTKHMTQQGTIQDLMGSGNLAVILNDSIRRAVATWEADMKLTRELEEDAKNSRLSYNQYLDSHIPWYERPDVETIVKEQLPQMLFLNRVADRFSNTDYLYHTYLEIQPRWQGLLELVNQEIRENRQE
jgi:hypothetical protein